MTDAVQWPDGKQFAFTVFDDTDSATIENVGQLYALLDELGLRTTKSCWVLRGDPARGKNAGQTCEDPDYRRWLLDLQAHGTEIAWHGSTWHGVPREVTADALQRFAAVFGHDPKSASNHTGVDEGIYWADARLTGIRRMAYKILTRGRNRNKYRGHLEDDPCFWGDLCRQKITYYRNFVFKDIDTLKACPQMPYHDPLLPYVNQWFAGSNGHVVDSFNECISEANQDRLEEAGGACIMYTHFAHGFTESGTINPRSRALLARLAKKNGWFVPVGTLLDFLAKRQGPRTITHSERRRLELKWLLEKVRIGTT